MLLADWLKNVGRVDGVKVTRAHDVYKQKQSDRSQVNVIALTGRCNPMLFIAGTARHLLVSTYIVYTICLQYWFN